MLLLSGEVLLGDLGRHGFRVTQDSEAVDCVLINTCGFVEDAKAESLEVSPRVNSLQSLYCCIVYLVKMSDVDPPYLVQAIMEAAQLKQNGQVKKVVVTGCLAQRYADELAGVHLLCHTIQVATAAAICLSHNGHQYLRRQ